MMDLQKKTRKSSAKIAMLLLLGLSLNIASFASTVAANTPTGGSFNKEMLEQKTEKEAVNQFYAAFLKNQVEKERLEEKNKQDLRHQAGYDAKHPELPKMFEIESIKLLMRYFDDSASSNKKVTSGAYFSSNVYNDLNVFPDPTNANRVTVFSDFSNLTHTMAGKLGLLEMLSNPLSDIEKLRERQKILEHLSKNNDLFNALDASLKKFGNAEKSLLYFMKTKDDGTNRDDFRRYFDEKIKSGNGNIGNDVMWYGGLAGRVAPSALLSIMALHLFWQQTKFMLGSGNAEFVPAWLMNIFDHNGDVKNTYYGEHAASIPSQIWHWGADNSGRSYAHYLTTYNVQTHRIVALLLMVAAAYEVKRNWTSNVVTRIEMGKRLQSCMIDVKAIVDATQEIAGAISRNDTLAAIIPGYKEVQSTVSGQDSGELKAILDTFDAPGFKGEANAMGPKGQIFKAFKVMCEKADKFTEIMRFVSRLDAFMSVAKALRKSANNPAKYSIPKFLKSEDGKPYLCAKKFWHPTLDPRKVVTNDLELGSTYRSVILTGANAGGKSTWMQGLALVAVLAQTFGVVPAESATLTPFALVIADTKAETTIGSESLYQNELRKLMDATKQIKSLGTDKFALYIVDEPLKGSDAKQCAAGAYAAIRSFGLHPNALVVVATHFQELTKLGDQSYVDNAIKGMFANYKVDSRLYECAKYPEKFLHHTYKVIPGVSTELVALHMLEEAYKNGDLINIDSTVSSQANEFLKTVEAEEATK